MLITLCSIPLISILAFWGMFKILYSGIISSAMYSFGNSNWIFYATVVDLPIRAGIMYWASFYGIEMIAISLVFIAFAKFFIYQYLLKYVTDIKLNSLFFDLKTVVFSSIIMTSVLFIAKYNFVDQITRELFLGLVIIASMITYIGVIYLIDRDFVDYTLDLFRRMKG